MLIRQTSSLALDELVSPGLVDLDTDLLEDYDKLDEQMLESLRFSPVEKECSFKMPPLGKRERSDMKFALDLEEEEKFDDDEAVPLPQLTLNKRGTKLSN